MIQAYDRSISILTTEIKKQQGIIERQKDILTQIQDDLRDLNSKTVETETAMTNINIMLRDSGFQGFEVRPRAEDTIRPDGTVERVVPAPARNYEVVRTDTEEVAKNLSEGEKNFIAFLYFQQEVFGNASADGDTREKIVVIDDPVSSMDSSSLFIVSAQVRKMIEICRNSVDNRNCKFRSTGVAFPLTAVWAFRYNGVRFPHKRRAFLYTKWTTVHRCKERRRKLCNLTPQS